MTMLSTLELRNFRCFEQHVLELQARTLLVGKNNAGKSTVEALRLVSLVTERMLNLPLKPPPPELELPAYIRGFRPSLESIAVHKEGVFYRYGSPPAVILASFGNGSSLEIHLGDNRMIFAIVRGSGGHVATTRPAIEAAAIPRVSILPRSCTSMRLTGRLLASRRDEA
jgi:hypothetical protein